MIPLPYTKSQQLLPPGTPCNNDGGNICAPCSFYPQYNCTMAWQDNTQVTQIISATNQNSTIPYLVVVGTWQSVTTYSDDGNGIPVNNSDPVVGYDLVNKHFFSYNFSASNLGTLYQCEVCRPCVTDNNMNLYCSNSSTVAAYSSNDGNWSLLPPLPLQAKISQLHFRSTTVNGNTGGLLYAFDGNSFPTLYAWDVEHRWTEWQVVPIDWNDVALSGWMHTALPANNYYTSS